MWPRGWGSASIEAALEVMMMVLPCHKGSTVPFTSRGRHVLYLGIGNRLPCTSSISTHSLDREIFQRCEMQPREGGGEYLNEPIGIKRIPRGASRHSVDAPG